MKREPCWWCSRQLWGNRAVIVEADGHFHKVHRTCSEDMQKDQDSRIYTTVCDFSENEWEHLKLLQRNCRRDLTVPKKHSLGKGKAR